MREVGAQLREVRLERGEDLDEIAGYLRIKPLYLYGIERGDMTVMPGRTYALGFLRTYADYLGFDGEDLITQIKSTVADLTGKTRFHIRAPLPENRLPKMPLLVLSLAIFAGVYVGWAYLNRDTQARLDEVPPIPEELAPAIAAPETRPAPDPAPDQARVERSPPANETAEKPAVGENDRAVPVETTVETPASARPAERPASEPAASSAAAVDPGTSSRPGELERITPDAGAAPEPSAAAVDPGASPAPGEPERIAPEAGESAPDRTGPSRPDADTGGDGQATVGAETTAGPGRAPGKGTVDAGPAREQPAAAAAAVTAVLETSGGDDGPTVHETVNQDARVIVRAIGETWLQIRSESGDYLRTRTLQAGDSFLVPNRDDLVLWTGNAGAVEFIVDGERVTPLGPDGSVIRDIPLAPEALLERARQPG